MAKRDEFPQNKSLRARLDCLILSHSNLRAATRAYHDCDNPSEDMKKRLDQQAAEALEYAELASQAISGMED